MLRKLLPHAKRVLPGMKPTLYRRTFLDLTNRDHAPWSGPELKEAELTIRDIVGSQVVSIKGVVPWFLRNMPVSSFCQVGCSPFAFTSTMLLTSSVAFAFT